jgi:hypothetical protein
MARVYIGDTARQALRTALVGGAGQDVINYLDDLENRVSALEGVRFVKEGIPAKAQKTGGKDKSDAKPAAPVHHEPHAHHAHAHHK